MRTIWKYRLREGNATFIEMPEGAEILHVGMQDDSPHLWVMLPDHGAPVIDRKFTVKGTGWEVEEGLEYLGTCFDGPYVWHVFEVE